MVVLGPYSIELRKNVPICNLSNDASTYALRKCVKGVKYTRYEGSIREKTLYVDGEKHVKQTNNGTGL